MPHDPQAHTAIGLRPTLRARVDTLATHGLVIVQMRDFGTSPTTGVGVPEGGWVLFYSTAIRHAST